MSSSVQQGRRQAASFRAHNRIHWSFGDRVTFDNAVTGSSSAGASHDACPQDVTTAAIAQNGFGAADYNPTKSAYLHENSKSSGVAQRSSSTQIRFTEPDWSNRVADQDSCLASSIENSQTELASFDNTASSSSKQPHSFQQKVALSEHESSTVISGNGEEAASAVVENGAWAGVATTESVSMLSLFQRLVGEDTHRVPMVAYEWLLSKHRNNACFTSATQDTINATLCKAYLAQIQNPSPTTASATRQPNLLRSRKRAQQQQQDLHALIQRFAEIVRCENPTTAPAGPRITSDRPQIFTSIHSGPLETDHLPTLPRVLEESSKRSKISPSIKATSPPSPQSDASSAPPPQNPSATTSATQGRSSACLVLDFLLELSRKRQHAPDQRRGSGKLENGFVKYSRRVLAPSQYSDSYYDKFELLQHDSGIGSNTSEASIATVSTATTPRANETSQLSDKDATQASFRLFTEPTQIVQRARRSGLDTTEPAQYNLETTGPADSSSNVSRIKSAAASVPSKSTNFRDIAAQGDNFKIIGGLSASRKSPTRPKLPNPADFKPYRLTDTVQRHPPTVRNDATGSVERCGGRTFDQSGHAVDVCGLDDIDKSPKYSWDSPGDSSQIHIRRFTPLSESNLLSGNSEQFDASWQHRLQSNPALTSDNLKTSTTSKVTTTLLSMLDHPAQAAPDQPTYQFCPLSLENIRTAVGLLLFGIPSSLFPNCRLYNRQPKQDPNTPNVQFYYEGYDSGALNTLFGQFVKVAQAYICLERLYTSQMGQNSLANLDMQILGSAVKTSQFAQIFSVNEHVSFLNSLKMDVLDVYQQQVVSLLQKSPCLLRLQSEVCKIGRPLLKLAKVVRRYYIGEQEHFGELCDPIRVMKDLNSNLIVHDLQTRQLLHKFLKTSLSGSIKEITNILFSTHATRSQYRENPLPSPRSHTLPFSKKVSATKRAQALQSNVFHMYQLSRSHLLKTLCDSKIEHFIYLKSLLPVDHWLLESILGLSLDDADLLESLSGIRSIVKEKAVLFKKVRLVRLDRMVNLSKKAQAEKQKFEKDHRERVAEARQREFEVKRQRMSEIEGDIRRAEQAKLERDLAEKKREEVEVAKYGAFSIYHDRLLHEAKQNLISRYAEKTSEAEARYERAKDKLPAKSVEQLQIQANLKKFENAEKSDSDVETENADDCLSQNDDGETSISDRLQEIETKTHQLALGIDAKFDQTDVETLIIAEKTQEEGVNSGFKLSDKTRTTFFRLNPKIILNEYVAEESLEPEPCRKNYGPRPGSPSQNSEGMVVDNVEVGASECENAGNGGGVEHGSHVESIEEYIRRTFTRPLDMMLRLTNEVCISHYLIDHKLMDVLDEINAVVFLKNAHFRQLLLEPLFEELLTRRNESADRTLSPLLLARCVDSAFSQATKQSTPVYLTSYNLQNLNFSNLAIISPFQVITHLQIDFTASCSAIITEEALKHYMLLSKLMTKLAFVKFQLNKQKYSRSRGSSLRLEFFDMRHMINCFEQYTSHILNIFQKLFLDDLEQAKSFQQVVDMHNRYLTNVFAALGAIRPRGDSTGQATGPIFTLVDRLLRVVSRCCELDQHGDSMLALQRTYKEYVNIRQLFLDMILKIADQKKSSIMQLLLVQLDFNGFYTKV